MQIFANTKNMKIYDVASFFSFVEEMEWHQWLAVGLFVLWLFTLIWLFVEIRKLRRS